MEDFEILSHIGEGATGRALLCKRKSSNELLVVKQTSLIGHSSMTLEQCKKEAELLSTLDHPNIIAYHESFVDQHMFCLVMEYADQGDLSNFLSSQHSKNLTEEQILDIFVQILLALKYLHDKNILHRDLKVQNVFLMKNGIVKLGDFGIAKVLDSSTQFSMTAVGSPYYLSPEICQGKRYNSKSDIWSLGCVLYELCALKHAFESNSITGLMMKIQRGKPSPIPFTYSPALRHLVDSMLQKPPEKRPSVNKIFHIDIIQKQLIKTARQHKVLSDAVQQVIVKAIKKPKLKPTYANAIKNIDAENKEMKKRIESLESGIKSEKKAPRHVVEKDHPLPETNGEQVKPREHSEHRLSSESSKHSLREHIKKARAEKKRSTQAEIEHIQIGSMTFEVELEKPQPKPEPETKRKLMDLDALMQYIDETEESNTTEEVTDDNEVIEDDKPENPAFILDGKEVVFPVPSDQSSMNHRIESIRNFIEDGIGFDKLVEIYAFLTQANDDLSKEEYDQRVESILNTPDLMKYYPIITHLLVCENSSDSYLS